MNRWIQRVVTFASLAGTLAVLPAGVAFAQTPDAQGQAPHGKHHRMHQRGLVGAALKLDSLSPEQRAQIEQLVQARRAANVPVRQADAQVLTVLAQQVEGAKADPQALAPSLAAERAATMNEVQVDRATLARLHAVLTPAQRNQLVDAIEAHAGGARGAREHEGKEGFGGAKLGLTQEQKAQIRASLGAERAHVNFQEKRAEMRAALESFRGDSFDPSGMARLQNRGEREVRMTNAMIPVLTPNQRAVVAEHLRNRAAHESRS
jgi:Spy/CpxP family protein refolding chaperone